MTIIFFGGDIKLDNHVINFYKNLFNLKNNSNYNDMVERIISHLITHVNNEYLTKISQPEKIKNAMYKIDGNSVPDPDGFGGYLFTSLLG